MTAAKLPGFVLFTFCSLCALRSDGAIPQSWSSITPTNKNLTAAMYGQNQFIAVGWGSMVIRSLNGYDWAQALQLGGPPGGGSSDHFFCAAYGNGMFVAGGQLSMLLAISPDGVNWTNIFNTIGTEHVYGLTFANGRFVGVGLGSPGYGQDSYIITSTNGIDWRGLSSSPTTNCLYAIAFGTGTSGSRLFVAVGQSGTIITSPDAFTWTVQNSGTTKNLRAITFNGSRFIAGGDGATIVTSTDGISWTSGAPPPFDVTGLASGGGVVIAVGVYNGSGTSGSQGRLHATSDGLGWPGNATSVSQPLNGVSYVNDRFIALGNNGLIVQSDLNQNQTNIWTKSTSGNWEEPYWSLGQLPSMYHDVIFTNSGYKAIAINSATTANYPNSVVLHNLTVDAPADSSNLLLLNYAGLIRSLDVVTRFTIGQRGALLSYASAIDTWYLNIDGRGTFAEGAVARAQELTLGSSAALTISNALISASHLTVAGDANQYGGSNLVDWLSVSDYGAYNLRGGSLIARVSSVSGTSGQFEQSGGFLAGDLQVEEGGKASLLDGQRSLSSLEVAGQFVQNGGSTGMTNGISLGDGKGAGGDIVLNGGTFDAVQLWADSGKFTQNNGAASMATILVGVPNPASFALVGGTLTSGQLFLGSGPGDQGQGTFAQTGGIHMNTNQMLMNGHRPAQSSTFLGHYTLAGGQLQTPALNINGGEFLQSAGSVTADSLDLMEAGRCVIDGGTLQANKAEIRGAQYSWFPAVESPLIQRGGSNSFTSYLMLGPGGIYQLNGGFLSISNFMMEGGMVTQTAGTNRTKQLWLENSGVYTLAGGTFSTFITSLRPDGAGNRAGLAQFVQTGGTHLIDNVLGLNAVYHLQGGTLIASNIYVDVDGDLRLEGGAVTNAGSFSIDNEGTCLAQGGNYNLGKLRVLSDGALSMFGDRPFGCYLDLQGASCIIRFADSHDLASDWTGTLVIRNWNGSVNGGGADQVLVGTSAQGLTASQVSRIVFADPGLASGNYPAKILTTGELVPIARPAVSFSRGGTNMVISWSGNYSLYSAREVTGPYFLVDRASSPYTNNFNEPHRFFQLRGP